MANCPIERLLAAEVKTGLWKPFPIVIVDLLLCLGRGAGFLAVIFAEDLTDWTEDNLERRLPLLSVARWYPGDNELFPW